MSTTAPPTDAEPTPKRTVRERIVDTALDLFYRQGYLDTGINQIIAEAGVAKASFYHHFPSKEALCLAYLEARHQVWGDWLEREIARGRTPRARLMRTFDFLDSWLPACQYRGCAFLNIASEIPDNDHQIRAAVARHKDALRQRFRQLVADVDDKLPAARLGDALYVLVEGAISGAQNFSSTWPIRVARRAFEALLEGAAQP